MSENGSSFFGFPATQPDMAETRDRRQRRRILPLQYFHRWRPRLPRGLSLTSWKAREQTVVAVALALKTAGLGYDVLASTPVTHLQPGIVEVW